MGRRGIEPDKIRNAINELDAEGKGMSVTSIRERLGSGSYSTIGAVLAAWRRERAEAVLPTVPAIPEGVSHLVRHLWAEAWKAADGVYEPERQTFQRERAEHEQLRAEKDQEIARLEAELSRVEAERESARAALTKAGEELERERVERAKAESTARTLQAELTELRVESRRATETVAVWVERASRAEARLEELAKGPRERRS
jgi:septal ring factor EnvC (AmiA/AmiB activator)